jgi:ferric-dicitrate binding protein FerR (iron transport regulator)
MTNMRTSLAGVLALLLLSGLPTSLFAASGTIVYTEGDVSVREGSQTRDAAIGDAVGPGSVIQTGPKSLAVIDLTNATMVKLREKTSLAIDSIGESTSVTLSAGAVFTTIARRLTGSFAVQTQSAAFGVRGTEFFVAYGRTIDANPDIWMCVNEGTVEAAIRQTGQTVLVPKGLGINIVGGEKITAPRAYAWTRRLNWNLDPQSGAVEDRTSLEQAYADLLDQDYD